MYLYVISYVMAWRQCCAYACGRTLATRSSRQSILGGDCPCRLCPVRNVVRCASFLTVLGIHCISRSFPLPPQCMLASLAAMSLVRPRVTRTPSRAQAATQSNTTRARSTLCRRPRSHAAPASIAHGPRGILWKRPAAGRAS